MSGTPNDTSTYATQITFVNKAYKISQPTNANFEYWISPESLSITTNFPFGNVLLINGIALDWTKITVPVAVDRTSMILAIENLATNTPVTISGPVSISGTVPVSIAQTLPVTIVPSSSGAYYTIQTTSAAAGTATNLAIKVNSAGGKMVLSSITVGSSITLGSGIGALVTLTKNPTVTGGTFTTFGTSIVQTNTGLTGITGGVDVQGFLVKNTFYVNLSPLNMIFNNTDILAISINNGGLLANTGVQLNFTTS